MDHLSGKGSQASGPAEIAGSVKHNLLPRPIAVFAQGMNIITVQFFKVVHEQGWAQQVKKEKQGGSHSLQPAWTPERDGSVHHFSPVENHEKEPETGKEKYEKMVRPEEIKPGHLPGKRGKEVDPVPPFDLHRVKEKMEQTVDAEYGKDHQGVVGHQSNGSGKQETEEKAGLNHAVKTQVVRIQGSGCYKYFQDYPRDVRDYAAGDNPPHINAMVEKPA